MKKIKNGLFFCGDTEKVLIENDLEFDCCITSPPYYKLRQYYHGEIGWEETRHEYVSRLIRIFKLIYDKLSEDGTCWINISDTYSHSGGSGKGKHKQFGKYINEGTRMLPHREKDLPPKTLCLIPQMLLIGLQDTGWIIRQVIIWHKPNPMPTSVKDRFTPDYEYVFFLSKNPKHYFKQQEEPCVSKVGTKSKNATNKHKGYGNPTYSGFEWEAKEGHGRNMRSVWTIKTQPYKDSHFAVFPIELAERMYMAGCKPGGIVIDPFIGSGTVAQVAESVDQRWIGIDINPENERLIRNRIDKLQLKLF